jgi:hypothetical protein
MNCTAKHTKYQPTEEEMRCPKCGAGLGDFCVDESAPGADEDCGLLHVEDILICYGPNGAGCDWAGASAQAFASRIAKAKSLVPCSHCKGKGLVPAEKGAKP